MDERALRDIEPLPAAAFDEFLVYLNEQLRDNGDARSGYFQPLPQAASTFPAPRAAAFRAGLDVQPGEPGWRRAWVLRDAQQRIRAHVDLRAHAEDHARHRCLLGMGVHAGLRRRGIGLRLIGHARQWACSTGFLDWMDLQVLAVNAAAMGLYRAAGFETVGETRDMFRLDGRSFSYVGMTLSVAAGGRPLAAPSAAHRGQQAQGPQDEHPPQRPVQRGAVPGAAAAEPVSDAAPMCTIAPAVAHSS
jgi:ribosomal protein S18 acetylase RimI-like enzyme